jgi:hypothetical protein
MNEYFSLILKTNFTDNWGLLLLWNLLHDSSEQDSTGDLGYCKVQLRQDSPIAFANWYDG